MQKTGELVEGELLRTRRMASYSGKKFRVDRMRLRKTGEEYLLIIPEKFPNLHIKTSIPDAAGNIDAASLEYLCSNLTGWNEFTQQVHGRGEFRNNGAGITLRISSLEALDITEGRIRRLSTRIAGEEALMALKNRRERILALTAWMEESSYARELATLDAFTAYWEVILFPELEPEKKRPAAWHEAGKAWTTSEDIRWNTKYSELLLSEELRPVRNSASMLRDWEEALDWIYLESQWKGILQALGEENLLQKTK